MSVLTEETANKLIDAMLTLNDTIERSIQSNSAITGVMSKHQEIKEIKKERQQIIQGTERSRNQVSNLRKRFRETSAGTPSDS